MQTALTRDTTQLRPVVGPPDGGGLIMRLRLYAFFSTAIEPAGFFRAAALYPGTPGSPPDKDRLGLLPAAFKCSSKRARRILEVKDAGEPLSEETRSHLWLPRFTFGFLSLILLCLLCVVVGILRWRLFDTFGAGRASILLGRWNRVLKLCGNWHRLEID